MKGKGIIDEGLEKVWLKPVKAISSDALHLAAEAKRKM
jgi:hypothetical protein